VKELAFLAAPVLLGMLGGRLAVGWGGEGAIPLWLDVLSGVLMGYLIGGAVVWGVRIFGSLGFGKEAMGLGDVHLMAAVGACVGWMDSVLAFFVAAFVGVFWAVGGRVIGGGFQRAMPYGPFLAVATVLVLVFKPFIELGLTALLRVPVGSPPINMP
jgi:leader peptidase (prepilin peptidase) / N-methyltransferase